MLQLSDDEGAGDDVVKIATHPAGAAAAAVMEKSEPQPPAEKTPVEPPKPALSAAELEKKQKTAALWAMMNSKPLSSSTTSPAPKTPSSSSSSSSPLTSSAATAIPAVSPAAPKPSSPAPSGLAHLFAKVRPACLSLSLSYYIHFSLGECRIRLRIRERFL